MKKKELMKIFNKFGYCRSCTWHFASREGCVRCKFYKKEMEKLFFSKREADGKMKKKNIVEEICEKELGRQKQEKERLYLENWFEVSSSSDKVYFDNTGLRICFNGVEPIDGGGAYVVYATSQAPMWRKVGFLKARTEMYYWGSEKKLVARIFPDKKTVFVYEILLYTHFKVKAEREKYKKIVKCWEGAI